MQALVTCKDPQGKPSAHVTTVTLPDLPDDHLLIRVQAVALNPVDALYVAHPIADNPSRVVGSDIAGVVVKVGESKIKPKSFSR
jgi:NADPH:quinone reductase-like Zn-dependent oxidoreductase